MECDINDKILFDPFQETKKSKLLLGKNNSKEDGDGGEKKSQDQQKDKFNLSNDEYYCAKNCKYNVVKLQCHMQYIASRGFFEV